MPVVKSPMKGEILQGEIVDWRDDEIAQLETLANLLDSAFAIPGTNIRIGLESVVGLIPGIGDAVGLVLSLYIVKRLSALNLPRITRMRMYGNVVIDAVGGLVPFAGDVFDVAFRANRRNIALAKRTLDKTRFR